MPDVEITCVQCRSVFTFSEKDQQMFYDRNMMPPQRCQKCRPSKRKPIEKTDEKQRFDIVCDICGKHDRVPFAPKVGRSVYCSDCYGASRTKRKH